MKNLLYLLVPVMLLASCSKDTEEAAQSLQPTSIANVSYGAHSAQVMDVYLPGGRTTDCTKAIVMIHGGGWNTGDKADFNEYITVLKQRLPDYAIFNINYRLASGSDLFPAQENDVKAAVEFIAARAGQYIFNKDKMVL
ncbi:MAG TPA: alpha/beta hydrolase, partial [Flavisolibacter sp.]